MNTTSGTGSGGVPAAPLVTENVPGLPALSYRVGTRQAFMAAMTRRLSSADHPALAGLRTRELNDPSMAMLDAWATAADVLTFYQERLCNEGYLRSATEQRSVRELAALVGWRPRPGVAASAYLAYTVDAAVPEVIIPAGSRANSVPGPGETMQAFESSTELSARAAWNELRPRMVQEQSAASVLDRGLYLAGVATRLNVNDALVLDLGLGTEQAVKVRKVTPHPQAGVTHVEVQAWNGDDLSLTVHRQVLAAAGTALDDVAETATAHRVTAALSRLSAAADPFNTAATLRTARHVLDAELAAARAKGWTRLVASLEQARMGIVAVSGPPGAAPAQRRAAPIRERGGLDELLAGLLRPASVPPATAQQLERSFTATFAGAGNVYPQLLTGLFSRLAPTLYPALAATRISNSSTLSVSALRQRCSLFGHNAPVPGSFVDGVFHPPEEGEDLPLARDEASMVAYLDGAVPALQPGQHVVMEHGAPLDPRDLANPAGQSALLTFAKSVRVGSRKAYGLTGQATTVVLSDDWWDPAPRHQRDTMANLRASNAYVQEESLELASVTITDPVAGGELELDGLYDSLTAGRWIIVSGERADLGTDGVQGAELLMLAGVVHTGRSDDGQIVTGEQRHTFLTFAKPLEYSYKRQTVHVYGNVVHATHGETRQEILGSGSAAAALQQFTLKAAPLTYLAAPTPDGAASTLVVRVNGVQWPEVPGLAYLGEHDRGFFITTAEPVPGNPAPPAVKLTFGDSPHGQRLPSGTDNIQAVYRTGIGAPGNVGPGRINQLATRPLGAKDVINPMAAAGGADPESRELTRSNAPRSVTALDRLVSVSDYADFAATFAGIGKASSALLFTHAGPLLQVTIAGLDDVPIEPGTDLFRNLRTALTTFGDAQLRVRLVLREALALVLSAGVKVKPGHDWNLVEPGIRTALLQNYGFAAMSLGEDLPLSAVIATIAAVPGVEYVDLDALRTLNQQDLSDGVTRLVADPGGNVTPAGPPVTTAGLPRRIAVLADRVVNGEARPAQLAYLQAAVPDSLILNEVKS